MLPKTRSDHALDELPDLTSLNAKLTLFMNEVHASFQSRDDEQVPFQRLQDARFQTRFDTSNQDNLCDLRSLNARVIQRTREWQIQIEKLTYQSQNLHPPLSRADDLPSIEFPSFTSDLQTWHSDLTGTNPIKVKEEISFQVNDFESNIEEDNGVAPKSGIDRAEVTDGMQPECAYDLVQNENPEQPEIVMSSTTIGENFGSQAEAESDLASRRSGQYNQEEEELLDVAEVEEEIPFETDLTTGGEILEIKFPSEVIAKPDIALGKVALIEVFILDPPQRLDGDEVILFNLVRNTSTSNHFDDPMLTLFNSRALSIPFTAGTCIRYKEFLYVIKHKPPDWMQLPRLIARKLQIFDVAIDLEQFMAVHHNSNLTQLKRCHGTKTLYPAHIPEMSLFLYQNTNVSARPVNCKNEMELSIEVVNWHKKTELEDSRGNFASNTTISIPTLLFKKGVCEGHNCYLYTKHRPPDDEGLTWLMRNRRVFIESTTTNMEVLHIRDEHISFVVIVLLSTIIGGSDGVIVFTIDNIERFTDSILNVQKEQVALGTGRGLCVTGIILESLGLDLVGRGLKANRPGSCYVNRGISGTIFKTLTQHEPPDEENLIWLLMKSSELLIAAFTRALKEGIMHFIMVFNPQPSGTNFELDQALDYNARMGTISCSVLIGNGVTNNSINSVLTRELQFPGAFILSTVSAFADWKEEVSFPEIENNLIYFVHEVVDGIKTAQLLALTLEGAIRPGKRKLLVQWKDHPPDNATWKAFQLPTPPNLSFRFSFIFLNTLLFASLLSQSQGFVASANCEMESLSVFESNANLEHTMEIECAWEVFKEMRPQFSKFIREGTNVVEEGAMQRMIGQLVVIDGVISIKEEERIDLRKKLTVERVLGRVGLAEDKNPIK